MEKLKLMEKLGISEQEADELIETDKRIDRGEKLFELEGEQAKASKQARQGDRKKEETKRTRKEDLDKRELITSISNFLQMPNVSSLNCEQVKVTNVEREMEFIYNGRKFKITLSAPRK